MVMTTLGYCANLQKDLRRKRHHRRRRSLFWLKCEKPHLFVGHDSWTILWRHRSSRCVTYSVEVLFDPKTISWELCLRWSLHFENSSKTTPTLISFKNNNFPIFKAWTTSAKSLHLSMAFRQLPIRYFAIRLLCFAPFVQHRCCRFITAGVTMQIIVNMQLRTLLHTFIHLELRKETRKDWAARRKI